MERTLTALAAAVALCAVALPATADDAYYSMIQLQGRSKLFARVSTESQANNDRAQREVVTTGRALDAFGDALVAAQLRTGARPSVASERPGALSARFDLDWKALNEFVDRLVMDTDRAFVEALQRQVGGLEEREGVTLGTCEPPQGVLGMAMGESGCEGTDYTDHVIALMDEDAELIAAVDDVNGRSWPSMRPEREPMAPIAPGDGADLPRETAWFAPAEVVRRAELFEPANLALEEGYRTAARELERARETHEINRQLSDGAGDADRAALDAELAALQQASERLTGWREQATGEAIALAWELAQDHENALLAALGVDAVGVCLQPGDLGGCSGADRTDDVAAYLSSQKKAIKVVSKHADGIETPVLGLE